MKKTVQPRSFYFRILRRFIDDTVKLHALDQGEPETAIVAQLRGYLDDFVQEPAGVQENVHYNEPLCRAAYVYRQAAAKASLFEHVISESRTLRRVLRGSDKDVLRIASIGGGPGSDLIGLLRRLSLKTKRRPDRIDFSVFDSNSRWGEEWGDLSDAALAELTDYYGIDLDVRPGFYVVDVFKASDYKDYRRTFRKMDVVVFNQPLSENGAMPATLSKVLGYLAERISRKCAIVFIESQEQQPSLRADLQRIMADVGLNVEDEGETRGQLDSEESAADWLGEYIADAALGRPRTDFSDAENHPGIFWIVGRRAG